MTVLQRRWLRVDGSPDVGVFEARPPSGRELPDGARLSTTVCSRPLVDGAIPADLDVVPGLLEWRVQLSGHYESVWQMVDVPTSPPVVPLSDLAEALPADQTPSILLTLRSVGKVVPGLNDAGQVLDGSGNPVGSEPAADLGHLVATTSAAVQEQLLPLVELTVLFDNATQ